MVHHVRSSSRASSNFKDPMSNTSNRFNRTRGWDVTLSKEFGDNIWQRKSAATLTHSVLNYSFSKGNRFGMHKRTNSTESMYNLQSTLGPRATSMGYGNKGVFSRKWLNDESKKPAPTHYRIPSDFDRNKLSKSFGIGYDNYLKAFPVGHPDYMSILESRKVPGPGNYTPTGQIGEDKLKYSLYAKGKMANDNIKWRSPGAIYNSNWTLVEQRRFHGCGFGYANKHDFTNNPTKKNPGPGHYKLPTIFDKFFSK